MSVPFHTARTTVWRRIRAARRVLVFSDFDGTLVPIMERPECCVLDPQVRCVLASLARDERVAVGVVSGRALADVRSRTGVDGIAYAGNHGLEIEGPGFRFVEPAAEKRRAALRRLVGELARVVPAFPGVWIQDKGFSASVHFRQAGDAVHVPLREAVRMAALPFVKANDVVLREGKLVLEIRPAVDWDKGSAVAWMAARMAPDAAGGGPLLYFGDDETDEDVFRRYPGGITVHVGSTGTTAARYTVPDAAGVHAILRWVLEVFALPPC
jgi:trehalose 6-phosphate phosphatase